VITPAFPTTKVSILNYLRPVWPTATLMEGLLIHKLTN
jgi:hypothetical protein